MMNYLSGGRLHNRRLCGVNTKQELRHSGHFEWFRVFPVVKMVNKKLKAPGSREESAGLVGEGINRQSRTRAASGNEGKEIRDPQKASDQNKNLICRDKTDSTQMMWIN